MIGRQLPQYFLQVVQFPWVKRDAYVRQTLCLLRYTEASRGDRPPVLLRHPEVGVRVGAGL
jgi:hypothetical protein